MFDPPSPIDEVLAFLSDTGLRARELAVRSLGDGRTPQRVLLTRLAEQAEQSAAGLKQSAGR